jgi:aspartate aminotransferase
MTCGAAASLCIALKAITESKKDEVLAIAPYFTEYKVFAEGAGATFKVVKPDMETFEINFNELEKEINENTKAIIVNSPNNPSGVVYKKDSLIKLSNILREKEKQYNHPIYIICDEPYREIVFDNIEVAHIPNLYDDTIVCYSYSKSLSLPGERIGYVLVPNQAYDSKNLYLACLGAGRAYGYVCAPSLMQHAIELCATLTSDMNEYKKNRDLIYNGLTKIGYSCVKPDGAFYLFMKALEDDAYKFMEKAKKYNIIVVPSDNFGVKGYVRLAYCVSSKTITDSMAAFKKLYEAYNK